MERESAAKVAAAEQAAAEKVVTEEAPADNAAANKADAEKAAAEQVAAVKATVERVTAGKAAPIDAEKEDAERTAAKAAAKTEKYDDNCDAVASTSCLGRQQLAQVDSCWICDGALTPGHQCGDPPTPPVPPVTTLAKSLGAIAELKVSTPASLPELSDDDTPPGSPLLKRIIRPKKFCDL